MRLPDVAARLRQLAALHGLAELDALASAITRRSPQHRAPVKSARMTAALSARIAQFAKDHPDMSQAEVGRRFNVNPGRVSESLRGKRA
jgi:hypothetical protein